MQGAHHDVDESEELLPPVRGGEGRDGALRRHGEAQSWRAAAACRNLLLGIAPALPSLPVRYLPSEGVVRAII